VAEEIHASQQHLAFFVFSSYNFPFSFSVSFLLSLPLHLWHLPNPFWPNMRYLPHTLCPNFQYLPHHLCRNMRHLNAICDPISGIHPSFVCKNMMKTTKSTAKTVRFVTRHVKPRPHRTHYLLMNVQTRVTIQCNPKGKV
jgi:hypothetical protein